MALPCIAYARPLMPPASVSVRVPATSANLGPGFDCLGLALDIWGTITLSRDLPEDDQPLGRMALNAARALFAAASSSLRVLLAGR